MGVGENSQGARINAMVAVIVDISEALHRLPHLWSTAWAQASAKTTCISEVRSLQSGTPYLVADLIADLVA